MVNCSCGNIIYDRADDMNKAMYISGGYTDDVIEQFGMQIKSLINEKGVKIDNSDIGDLIWSTLFFEYCSDIYECDKCGRLLVQCSSGEEQFMAFQPEENNGSWITSNNKRVQRGNSLIKNI